MQSESKDNFEDHCAINICFDRLVSILPFTVRTAQSLFLVIFGWYPKPRENFLGSCVLDSEKINVSVTRELGVFILDDIYVVFL